MPLKNVLAPPHLESTATVGSEASHEPEATINAPEGLSGTWVRSPGSAAETPTTPPRWLVKSLTKSSHPERALEALREAALGGGLDFDVARVMAIPPASTRTAPPGGSVTSPKANAGPALISISMPAT